VQHEIIERQKQFERDPSNRRRSAGGQLRGASHKVADATGSLAKAAAETAGKAGQSLAKGAKQAQQRLADGSETQQWVGIGSVVVIWAIILWLVFG
jgi:hypothetical protein